MRIGVFLLRLSLQRYIFCTIQSMLVGERIFRMLVAINQNQNFLTFGLFSYSGHSMLSSPLSHQSPRFDKSVVLLVSTRRQAKWLPSRFMTPRSATIRFEPALC